MGQHKTWHERREQLIRATVESIHELGLEKTSVQRVANRAGLTAGVVAHYFGDKEGLLNATYAALYEKILANAERVAHSKDTPSSQVKSILLAYLAPDQLTPEIISAWYVLVARLRHSPELRKVQINAEFVVRNRLCAILEKQLSPRDAKILAAGMFAMVTGFWIQMASALESRTYEEYRKDIVAVIERYLLAFSGPQVSSKSSAKKATAKATAVA